MGRNISLSHSRGQPVHEWSVVKLSTPPLAPHIYTVAGSHLSFVLSSCLSVKAQLLRSGENCAQAAVTSPALPAADTPKPKGHINVVHNKTWPDLALPFFKY